ncbi:hypothetical protein TNCV_4528531 [Trichonephila clavipes]|nr:hypothetical protein TNCV_4528531 [Trichonephila clavipes]
MILKSFHCYRLVNSSKLPVLGEYPKVTFHDKNHSNHDLIEIEALKQGPVSLCLKTFLNASQQTSMFGEYRVSLNAVYTLGGGDREHPEES